MLAGMTAPARELAVDVRGLRKRYGGVTAVDGLDPGIRRGEVFGLLGPNGAGRSTTVEILQGNRPRDGGEVSVLGADPATGTRAWGSGVGFVWQDESAPAELTVSETVRHFARCYPRPRDPGRPSVRSASTRTGGLHLPRSGWVFLPDSPVGPGAGRELGVRADRGGAGRVVRRRTGAVPADFPEGCTNAETGRRPYIGESTVTTHLLGAFGTLGGSDRTAAVTRAMRYGLLEQ